MSGVEVVGLILAALPLVISGLEAYKEGRNPVKTFAWKWRFELESLLRCLKEQRWFFRNSVQILLQAAAIDESLKIGTDPAELLEDPEVRSRLTTYLQDAETLEFFDGVVQGYRSSLEELIQRLGHIRKLSTGRVDIVAVLAANLTKDGQFGFGGRFEFTMKHKEMRRHITTLDSCNDKLKKMIDRIDSVNQTKRKDLTKEQTSKQLAASLQQIRHHAIALHATIASSWATGCQPIHSSVLFLESRVAKSHSTPAKISFHSVLACDDQITTLHAKCQETIITVDQISPEPNQQQVQDLCNWLAQTTLAGQALGLALDKGSKLFRSETCLKAHFDQATVQDSVSLEWLLSSGVRLTPQQRTVLAFDVASSLLQLQTTPWYRTTWTSKLVRFFRQLPPNQPAVDCRKPFIAKAFPDNRPEHSEGAVKADLLELGIMLLEIWNTHTFSNWTSKKGLPLQSGYYARMSPAIQWLEEEADMMTPSYADAVSVCVRFSFEGVQHSWEHPAFRRTVCEKVLGSLQENCKAWLRT